MNEALGIVEYHRERVAKYGHFAYRAPYVAPPPHPAILRDPTGGLGRFRSVLVRRIVASVSKAWEIEPEALLASNRLRSREYVYPRFACWRLLRERQQYSHPVIGRIFGRDHTTVIDGVKRAGQLFRRQGDWRKRYDAAVAELDQ